MNNVTGLVTTLLEQGVLRVGISRPEKRNALTLKMYEALTAALETAEQDDKVRVVLIHGTENCFTSGNDLHDFAQTPPAGEDSPVFRFLRAISSAKKPLVAMISGPAVGIGTTLLLHCDLVYADETARLKLPFANLGLCPEAASSYLLPKLVGHLRAAELLMLGEAIDADRAVEIGLVNRVFPQAEMHEQVLAILEKLALQPPESIRLTKSLLKEDQNQQIATVMSKEGKLFIEQLGKPEAKEAISAFFQGRKADFSQFS